MTGTGLECGLLCRSVSHYRADFSSTGLLRDNIVYLNVKNGGDLIAAVDAAHALTAAGYSTTGARQRTTSTRPSPSCSVSFSWCKPRNRKDG